MPLKKQLAGLKRFAKVVDTSAKDASRARKVARSPKMQQEITDDRRTALAKNFRKDLAHLLEAYPLTVPRSLLRACLVSPVACL